ncbi:MAG: primosomal protein N', partial [Caldilineaceae bacterium]|nr:primosomal protein N' [Caldilineaceae bacterium]
MNEPSPALLTHVEVIVNVPIRPSFSRREQEAPPPGDDDDGTSLQTFTYALPPDLEGRVQPGHLIWVPFGRQTVQGIVIQLVPAPAFPTKDVQRLARPLPVLTPAQIRLAEWTAHTYVASLSESVKLFLPPGLLTKDPDSLGVRAKREEQVEILVDRAEMLRRLPTLGRETQQVTVLAWLLDHPNARPTVKELQTQCKLRSVSSITTLHEKGLIRMDDQAAVLNLAAEDARSALLDLRGAAKYLPTLEKLLDLAAPVWKTDLYAQVDTSLTLLRDLQAAGLIRLDEQVRYRDPLAGRTYARTFPPSLTDEQAGVWAKVAGWFDAPTLPAPQYLLHGVTGSGKTEIYLHAIARTLEQGKQAIVLVPEIALTPQTVARFAGRFPGQVAVIHSELSKGERYDTWRRIRDGEVDIVVGPRSALFSPLPRLGLIILDEEHESSYKQAAEEWGSNTVFYDARTLAIRLAELTGSPLILGSATPSLESYHSAIEGKLTLLELPRRVMGHRSGLGDQPPTVLYAEMPPVEIVDMRQELRAGNRSILSRSLQAELVSTFQAGEQAILFLNRRGTSTFVMCRDCGHVVQCDGCDVPLTYHERVNVLVCHHCNKRYPIPDTCPECNSKRIKYFGSGTQRLEELVQEFAPRARILRWDADTTGHKGSHEAIMTKFAAHEADILVGTQMIAKGLDLPMVTLVGAIAADTGLFLPDFRSGERTFQLLTQVAGRAGRSERGGRVVIQTYRPDHYAIQAAAQHDFHAFYQREIAFRREHRYPPIRRLAKLVYWDKKLEKAQIACADMTAVL